MAQVVFNPATFKVRYPQFAAVSDDTLTAIFPDATLYLSNSDDSPVQDIGRRTQLFNMLVAHIGELDGLLSADGQARPVGRLSQAAEGSVSASLDYTPATPGSGPWFQQTQAGASFWAATINLRGFQYRPPVFQRRCY